VNAFKQAAIFGYAVGAAMFAVGWQLLEDTVRDIRQLQQAQREMKGWWEQ
jgi:hypothetical protein